MTHSIEAQHLEEAQSLEIPSIPANLGERARSGLNLRYIVAGVLVFAFIGVVAFMSISTGSYWLTVSELQQDSARYLDEYVRISGPVVDGSEEWNPQAGTLRFAVADANGAQQQILFYGPRPDNFQRATEAIIEGRLLPDGSFQADNLLLKCPSRYEEEPEEIYVESTR